MRRHLAVRAECYAGYRGEETPRRLFFGERAVAVVDIIDRWPDPEQRYFKLRGDDGGVYIVRHDVPCDRWELTLYDSGARDRLSST